MTIGRRKFMNATKSSLGASLAMASCQNGEKVERPASNVDYTALDRLSRQVLRKDGLNDPLIIEKMELLHYRNIHWGAYCRRG